MLFFNEIIHKRYVFMWKYGRIHAILLANRKEEDTP